MNSEFIPRRSVLYMPGANLRALDKARSLPADALILDLEDAVAPDAKTTARDQVIGAVAAGGYGSREIIIRINSLGTEWGPLDLDAAANSGVDAILLPKVGSVGELEQATEHLNQADKPPALWIMAETPRCILDIDAIAGSGLTRVIVMGTADLAKSMRVPHDLHRTGLQSSLSQCVLAARAHGLDILDGVFTDLTDPGGLREQCIQGRMLGFDGKTLIHPGQIDAANEVFGVSDAEAAAAAEIVSAWDKAAAQGVGVAVLNGQMIEKLHAEEARRLLALRSAYAARA